MSLNSKIRQLRQGRRAFRKASIRVDATRVAASRPSSSAFTLVELMVVVVLIGIMTTLILPEMMGTYEDALLRSNSRKLITVFNLAYSQAVSLNQPHRVLFDRKTGRYAIEKAASENDEGGAFVPLKNVPGSEGELDTRISVEIRKAGEERSAAPETAPREAEADLRPGSVRETPGEIGKEIIAFYPDGTADSGEVLLKDRQGFRLVLRINPTTARVRIVELERE